MPNLRRSLTGLAVIAANMGISAPVLSQTSENLVLEEVLVTAQKRQESLQTVPVSVAVETAASIDKKSIVDLSTLATRTPNLYIEDGGATANIAMRGLGSPGIESIEPSVGLYIDNISVARPRGITQNPFYDLERIEVLRGPQGTLWGRNTIAGAVNILTAKPTDEFTGYASAEFGNYNMHKAEVVVSGPIFNTLSGRLSVYNAHRSGYLENHGIGPDGGGIDSEAYRGQLRWQPTENFSALLKYEHVNHAQLGHTLQLVGMGPAGLSNPYTQQALAAGEDYDVDLDQVVNGTGLFSMVGNNARQQNSSDLATLTFDWDVAGHTITAQSGYVDYETFRVMEFSGGPINVIGLGMPNLPGIPRNQKGDTLEFFSQELRIASPQEQRFSYVAGLYYDDLEVVQTHFNDGGGAIIDAAGTILLANNGDVEDVKSYSAYFEGNYKITDAWIVTAGIRSGKEEKDFKDFVGLELVFGGVPSGVFVEDGGTIFFGNQTIQNLSRDDSYTTWSGKLQFLASDDAMFYATVATGFKSGGFNNGGNTLIIQDKVVNEENSISIELGSKLTFAEGRGRFNAALFRTKFEDLQVSKSDETTGVIVTTNAAEAITQGIELEATWRLTEAWTLGGSYAYLDAEYDKFDNAPCGPFLIAAVGQPCSQDLSGERLQRAPENSGTLYVEYFSALGDTGWDLNGYLGWSYRDETFTTISNEFKSDTIELFDARLAVSNADGWVVALKGSNLTDERSLILVQDNTLLGGDQFGVITPPRMYSLQIRKTF